MSPSHLRASRRAHLSLAVLMCAGLFATSGSAMAQSIPRSVPPATQRPGDPDAGYEALISKGWVGCGVPALYYDIARALIPDSLEPEFATLPGRPEGQEDLPYFLNRFETDGGVDVVAPNCLLCHAGRLNGELIVGLGNADGRNQFFDPRIETVAKLIEWGSWLYFWSPSRRAEMKKVGERVAAAAAFIQVPIEGANPTHNLAWALVKNRHRDTLAWSDEPTLPLPPPEGAPSDVPPWWRMEKKHAMFAAAGGQGDHTGFMAVNSVLCVDDHENYEELYAYFNDIRAYLASIEPPEWPYDLDSELVADGAEVFVENCEGCHGSYGDEAEYPNRLVPLERIGTDPILAQYNVVTSTPAREWLNDSIFTRSGTYTPYLAYVAPPLDGIWATPPFLHNGTVPTLSSLLDSSRRPAFWTWSYDSNDYDSANVGWSYQALEEGHAGEPDADRRRRITDTTLTGFSNAGHEYGDDLSDEDRRAVIEYLKTL